MNNMEVGDVENVVKVNSKNKVQDRFFIDVSDDVDGLGLIHSLLKEVNTKKYGRKLILKDLVLVALTKLKPKDLEAIKESSLGGMEQVQRRCDQYNEANGTKLSFYEYAHMMLKKNGVMS